MKERPILFSAPMVRAILEGRKTQTRRVVKCHPAPLGDIKTVRLIGTNEYIVLDDQHGLTYTPYSGSGDQPWPTERYRDVCPYGGPGDQLWVRETWQTTTTPTDRDTSKVVFAADYTSRRPGFVEDEWSWRPSIFMPRWASRITLDVVGVRVERLHAITDEDAKAEGVIPYTPPHGCISTDQRVPGPGFDRVRLGDQPHRLPFADLWRMINAESWDANPWVWVVEFKRIEAQERAA